MGLKPTVFVIDDDEAVRRFLSGLIASVGLSVELFASAQEFLDAYEPGQAGCIVLDIRMPGMSGLELQKEIAMRNIGIPVIILTGHGDVEVAVHAMKAGAWDFIEKPFNNELLLDQIQQAVKVDADSARDHARQAAIMARLDLLTRREHQVLFMVVAGDTNKAIARTLAISDRTVEIYRSKVMEKMQAKSLAHLVRMTMVTGGN